jgi:hypothetical protein
MPATATTPAARRRSPDCERLFAPEAVGTRRRTLEEEALEAWDRLRAGEPAGCLVCGARVESGGPCPSCGSELS